MTLLKKNIWSNHLCLLFRGSIRAMFAGWRKYYMVLSSHHDYDLGSFVKFSWIWTPLLLDGSFSFHLHTDAGCILLVVYVDDIVIIRDD